MRNDAIRFQLQCNNASLETVEVRRWLDECTAILNDDPYLQDQLQQVKERLAIYGVAEFIAKEDVHGE